MRHRWAAVMVLLASVLLHLFVPQSTPDRVAAVETSAAPTAGALGGTAQAEAVREPCPCEEDASVRHVAVRSPRTAGTAGAGGQAPAGAPAQACTGARDPGESGSSRAGDGPGADAAGPTAPALQTFRC
ncbi:hypothetical protein ACWD00_01645 [Streptomyces viridiviolaceus]